MAKHAWKELSDPNDQDQWSWCRHCGTLRGVGGPLGEHARGFIEIGNSDAVKEEPPCRNYAREVCDWAFKASDWAFRAGQAAGARDSFRAALEAIGRGDLKPRAIALDTLDAAYRYNETPLQASDRADVNESPETLDRPDPKE